MSEVKKDNSMFSIVIRNKNEADYLEKTLQFLHKFYKEDFDEIIVVDNNSEDDSLKIAKQYKCKLVFIDKFTYGKAINMGIKACKNNYILLLSAHAVPIGTSFFKNTKLLLNNTKNIAGIRYINSYSNYQRSLENNFVVKEPLKYGIMAACCIVVKAVWEDCKFNEELPFSEDKHWSHKVALKGFNICDINETFFYYIKRTKSSELNRFKNETYASYQLGVEEPSSSLDLIIDLFKRLFYMHPKNFINNVFFDIKKSRIKFKLKNKLKKQKNAK